MIDLKLLRATPDLVRESQRTRGDDPGVVDEVLAAMRRAHPYEEPAFDLWRLDSRCG